MVTDGHDPDDDRYAYSRTALARLVLSYERVGRLRYCLRAHTAAYKPTATGRSLDEWARKRGHGEHVVTDGLPTLGLLEEMNQILADLNHLYIDMHTPPSQLARARLLERKAALLDRIAVEEAKPEAAEQAAEARARAAQLRAEGEGTPPASP